MAVIWSLSVWLEKASQPHQSHSCSLAEQYVFPQYKMWIKTLSWMWRSVWDTIQATSNQYSKWNHFFLFIFLLCQYDMQQLSDRSFIDIWLTCCWSTSASNNRSVFLVFLQCILRGCVVVLSGIVVLVIPNFSTLMAFFGSSCCTLLGFVLPGIFHLRIFEG